MPSCADSAANLLGADTNGWPVSPDQPGGDLTEAAVRIESGSHGRTPDGECVNPGESSVNAVEPLIDLRHPARDHLAQRQRRRVLKVCPSHQDNIAILSRFLIECVAEATDGRNQLVVDCLYGCDVHRGGKVSFDD